MSSAGGPPARVSMCLPASSRFVRLVRIAAADLAARASFDVEEIEGVRLAVDELCFWLLDVAREGVELQLEVVADTGRGRLEVAAAAEADPDKVGFEASEMTHQVIAALVDAYELTTRGRRVTFRMASSRAGLPR